MGIHLNNQEFKEITPSSFDQLVCVTKGEVDLITLKEVKKTLYLKVIII